MEQVLVESTTGLLNYGVLGIVVIALGFFVWFLIKNYINENKARITVLESKVEAHEKELKELREHDAKREAASTAAVERNTEVMSGVMEVITGLRLDLARFR
jgi:Tfp pilus assembly protein PilN